MHFNTDLLTVIPLMIFFSYLTQANKQKVDASFLPKKKKYGFVPKLLGG